MSRTHGIVSNGISVVEVMALNLLVQRKLTAGGMTFGDEITVSSILLLVSSGSYLGAVDADSATRTETP